MTRNRTIAATITACIIGFALGYCHPAPAQTLRDPYLDAMRPLRDPYYTAYPFQTPAQASRQLDADRHQRRRDEAQLDAIRSLQPEPYPAYVPAPSAPITGTNPFNTIDPRFR